MWGHRSASFFVMPYYTTIGPFGSDSSEPIIATLNSIQPSLHNANLPPRVPTALPLGVLNIWPRSELHGVSASSPTWSSVSEVVTGCPEVVKYFTYAYPRFVTCPDVRELHDAILDRLKVPKDNIACLVYPSKKSADRCMNWLRSLHPNVSSSIVLVDFHVSPLSHPTWYDALWNQFYVLVFPLDVRRDAMAFWRDTGSGIATRHAAYCLLNFDYMASDSSNDAYRTSPARIRASGDVIWPEEFLKWDTNLQSIKSKMSELLASSHPEQTSVDAGDIFLYKTGMSAIYAISEGLAKLNPDTDVVAYGWLYAETVNILRFSPYKSCISFKWGSEEELDELEDMLISGRRISALFCELPSNIKLTSPNLERIKTLSRKYGFVTVCDDTVGNFVNIDVLPWLDVIVTSLTKIFSGAANVTAGSITINPISPHYQKIKSVVTNDIENSLFPTDLAILNQNCQDVVWRVLKSNDNTMALIDLLKSHPLLSQLNFPILSPTSSSYQRHMRAPDRCGNMMSIVFHYEETAKTFYNHINVCKGSSFGTNFTLMIPFVQLAGYFNQDKLAEYGLPPHIIRISVGLEDKDELVKAFKDALDVAGRFQNGHCG